MRLIELQLKLTRTSTIIKPKLTRLLCFVHNEILLVLFFFEKIILKLLLIDKDLVVLRICNFKDNCHFKSL